MTNLTLNVRQVKEMLNGFLEKYEIYEDTYKKILGLPFVVSHMEELKTPALENFNTSDANGVWRQRLNELSENNKMLEKQLLDATENFNLKEMDWKSKLDALVESNKWYERSLTDIVKFNETAYARSLENDELVKTLKSQLDNALIELNVLKTQLQKCTSQAYDTIESKENIELIVEPISDEQEEHEPNVELEEHTPDVELEEPEPEPDVEMEEPEPDVEMEEPEPDVEIEAPEDAEQLDEVDDKDSVVTTETLTEEIEPEPVVEEPKADAIISEEKEADNEEDEELFEIEIDEKSYCTNDDTNGFIWVLTEDGEQGEKVGYFKDGECFFYEDEQ